MFSAHKKLSHLFQRWDNWTKSTKLTVAFTLVIFASIPLTVIALLTLRTFSSQAAGGVYPIDTLVPAGAVTSTTPKFSWICRIGCNPLPDFYTILLSEKPFTQFSEFQNGWTKIVVKNRSTGTINNFTNWGGWGSMGMAQATRTLKSGMTYYWQVMATFSGYDVNTGAPLEVSAVQSFTTPSSRDRDWDVFSDTLEYNIGTNPYLGCGDNAWPPDFNNDKVVNILDLTLHSEHNRTSDRRYDLNMDGLVDTSDFDITSSYYLKTCSTLVPF